MATRHNQIGEKVWKSINVKAPDSYHQLIDGLVKSGKYESKSHVIRTALDILSKAPGASDSPSKSISDVGLTDVLTNYDKVLKHSNRIVQSAETLFVQCGVYGFITTAHGEQAAIRNRIAAGKSTHILTEDPKTVEVKKVISLTRRQIEERFDASIEIMCRGYEKTVVQSSKTQHPLLSINSAPIPFGITLSDEECAVSITDLPPASVFSHYFYTWVFRANDNPTSAHACYLEYLTRSFNTAREKIGSDLLSRYFAKEPSR